MFLGVDCVDNGSTMRHAGGMEFRLTRVYRRNEMGRTSRLISWRPFRVDGIAGGFRWALDYVTGR